MSEKYEMKSLEQQAEKYYVAEYGISDPSHKEDVIEDFLAGASATMRILSEKEGRKVTIKGVHNNGGSSRIGIISNEIDDSNFNLLENETIELTEAAPLRARVRVLEEMLESERKDFCKHMNGADEKLNRYIEENAALKESLSGDTFYQKLENLQEINRQLQVENLVLQTRLSEKQTEKEMYDRLSVSTQAELTTLRAQLEEAIKQRNTASRSAMCSETTREKWIDECNQELAEIK